LDTYPLLAYDGAGGGTLLGFPFVTARVAPSAGAVGVFFACDWQESLIGLDPSTVTVSVRGAPAVNLAIVSATMPLDCNLRRIPAWLPTFAWF
jgi:hypothetical protein